MNTKGPSPRFNFSCPYLFNVAHTLAKQPGADKHNTALDLWGSLVGVSLPTMLVVFQSRKWSTIQKCSKWSTIQTKASGPLYERQVAHYPIDQQVMYDLNGLQVIPDSNEQEIIHDSNE